MNTTVVLVAVYFILAGAIFLKLNLFFKYSYQKHSFQSARRIKQSRDEVALVD